ncbi:MAG TPA: 2-oxo acid dehydrogenase subunit E2 [Tissierellia bacterium]|nr:2-oxo acid dehydrogenase subunit E2 [Tissierellia bacterium]
MRRKEGRKIKNMDPFIKIFPYVMNRRTDSQIFAKERVTIDPIEDYLAGQRAQGHNINFLHLFIAIYTRVLAQRPKLNRFIINNQYYARHGITISMAVKRRLVDTAAETTVKFNFVGTESIYEVAEIVDRTIANALSQDEDSPNVDRLVNLILKMPGVIKKGLVGLLLWMDRMNLVPGSVIDVSPFHASLFFSHLRSIRAQFVYHHLYNVGTCGVFVAVGKAEKMAIVENDEVVVRNCIEIGYTLDERLSDGLYIANSFRLVKQYLDDPSLLETPLEAIVEDVE